MYDTYLAKNIFQKESAFFKCRNEFWFEVFDSDSYIYILTIGYNTALTIPTCVTQNCTMIELWGDLYIFIIFIIIEHIIDLCRLTVILWLMLI